MVTIIILSKFPSAMFYLKSSSTISHVEKNLSNSHDVIGIVKYFLIYTKIEDYLTKGISIKNFFSFNYQNFRVS